MRTSKNTSTVSSFNDWDPLEEVILGDITGATVPEFDCIVKGNVSPEKWPFFQKHGGKHFPEELTIPAKKELEELCRVLEGEGVTVRRPTPTDFSKKYQTPDFVSSGLYSTMPRDILAVIGDEIIEAPMAWRSRFFEYRPYRTLLKEYLKKGCKWTACPKPLMDQELYRDEYDGLSQKERDALFEQGLFSTTDSEPCFEAADILRCGKDLFVQRSQVTNQMGILWLKNHFRGRFRVHQISFNDPNPMHVDATVVALKPGLLLTNPKKAFNQVEWFKKNGWDVMEAAQPTLPKEWPLYLSSNWLSMNFLSLDENRVVVEKQEIPTQNLLKSLGIKVIPVDFRHVYTFGGSLHCVTCDIRRKGQMDDFQFDKVIENNI